MRKLRFGIGWMFLLLVGSMRGQTSFSVDVINTAEGLSQGVVLDVLQDQEGFLWLGTKDGLNRYDGQTFKVFTNDPNDPYSLAGNTVNVLFEDSAGRIWAASENAGLSIYDKTTGRFHRIQHDPENPATISGNNIGAIVEDSSGYFVIGVTGVGVNMIQLEPAFFEKATAPSVVRVPLPPQPRLEEGVGKDVRCLIKDTRGRIWVGAEDAIFQLDVPAAEMKLGVEGYSFDQAYAHPDGSIWGASSNHGLFRWDGEKAFTVMEDVRDINDWELDENGKLWVGWSYELLGVDLEGWQPGQLIDTAGARCFFRWVPERNGEALNFPIKSMRIDRSGLIWIGTNGFGLYRLNPSLALLGHQLAGKSVRHFVFGDPDYDFYAVSYSPSYHLPDNRLLDIPLCSGCESPPDMYLVSRSGGHWRRDYVEGRNYSLLKSYDPKGKLASQEYKIPWNHNSFQPMVEGKDGAIYMAGSQQLFTRLDPATEAYKSYSLKTGRLVSAVNSRAVSTLDFSTALFEDSEGTWWVGSREGFVKCNWPKQSSDSISFNRFQNIPGDTNSLSYNYVSSFLEDPTKPERYLWIATKGGGLNRLDKTNNTFLRIESEDGLPDKVVYGILADDAGNIWGSTNRGIFCLLPEPSETGALKFTIRTFSKEDGLQEDEFNTGAYAKLPDGRLLFGGVNGYNIFRPEAVLAAGYTPPVYITGLLINNKRLVPGDPTAVLSKNIEATERITLDHLQDIVTLEFASLDFQNPKRLRYRYQLVGATDGWVEAGRQNSATFLHLAPKEYTFRVQGSNGQGVWSDRIAELKIQVLPPWWKTNWAYLAYLLIIVGVIGLILRFIVRRTKLQQQLAFQKRESDRVRELDSLKTQLYMNMTHEFRTPLTIILGMAQQVVDDPKQHFRQGMNMIMENGQNLLGMVNRMLSLSKLENGKMSLNLIQGDILVFLRRRAESFRSFAANKRIELHFLAEVDEVVMDYDPEKLQQVISNLLSNAFKFTPEGGHIYFGVREEGGSLTIRVKDTGRGISEEDQAKVFDRFFQADNSPTRKYEGTGIGLALCKELVKLMEGDIRVQSPPRGARIGTEFTVRLPIRHTAPLGDDQVTPQEFRTGEIQEPAVIPTSAPELDPANEAPIILLAEDNPDVVTYVTSCLTDYQVVVAENGQIALEKAIEIIPDLLISDVMMPLMDGFELCQQIKTDPRTNHIPVVILTARADLDSKLEGLELGANAYLPKPFEKKELLLTINNLLQLRDQLQVRYQNLEARSDTEEVEMIHEVEDTFVREVRAIIEARIDEFELNVESLAQALHLSPSQFRRKLNALTGYSPNQYIRHLRFKQAKELLRDESQSVTAVAYSCGFSDPSYFTRAFKKEFGKTPQEWRMEAR
jgi:signal transduction histidine kinase/DNA-binding response OmpR family regulator/ligand-binding sensor domain-containing protein